MKVVVTFRAGDDLLVADVETGEEYHLPRKELDFDGALLQDDAAFDALVDALSAGPFPAEILRPGVVTVHPRMQLAPGPAGPYRGWRSRGAANWHVIKHALHTRAIPIQTDQGWRRFSAEDWPAAPEQTRARLADIGHHTRCGVPKWGPATAVKGLPPPCHHCPAVRAAVCLGRITDAWFDYDAATRSALGAPVRTERKDGYTYSFIDLQTTRAMVVYAPDGWRSVTTWRTLSRKLGEAARAQGDDTLRQKVSQL